MHQTCTLAGVQMPSSDLLNTLKAQGIPTVLTDVMCTKTVSDTSRLPLSTPTVVQEKIILFNDVPENASLLPTHVRFKERLLALVRDLFTFSSKVIKMFILV
jgi:hypothetical protein